MYVLVLTSAAGVPDADLTTAAAALGFRAANRLDDRAVEARLDIRDAKARATALQTARTALADRAIDVNIVSAIGREKRLLIADMDSTIIGCECVDEVADVVGVKAEVAAITERAMQGEVAFEAALRERVQLLAGVPVAQLQRVYEERVALNPGARTLVRTMVERGARTALVSGGFTFFAERVAKAAGFHQSQANVLLEVEGALTGAVAEPILGREAKRVALETISGEIGRAPQDAVAVGDGANDLSMIQAAGLGVAYRAKPVVAAKAGARLNHSDLTAILSLQGVGADAFVS